MFVKIDELMHYSAVRLNYEAFPKECAVVGKTANGAEVMALLGPELIEKIDESEVKFCVMLAANAKNMGFAMFDEATMEAAVLVYLNGDSTEDIQHIVSHELVHCAQLESGRLWIEHGEVYWEGKPYSMFPLPTWVPISTQGERQYFVEVMKYNSQPWEKEANADIWADVFGDLNMELVTSWARDLDEDEEERFIIYGGKPWEDIQWDHY